jgi:hypothetical protein
MSRPDTPEGHDPYALTVLRSLDAHRPLTKRYDIDATGNAVKTAYTGHKHFAVEEIRALNIQDLAEHMQRLERDPSAAIIRGAPLATTDRSKALRRSNGATATFEDVPRGWFMADLDDVPLPASMSVTADPHEAAAHLVGLLTGFAPDLVDVTAVVQFSSSAGIADIAEAEAVAGLPPRWAGVAKPGNRVGGHIWFMLARPESSAAVKRWALGVNARAGKKLVDPALFQSIHLHYVAAPIFGQGLRDPLAGRRVQIVQGLEDAATLTIPEFSTAPLRGATADFAGWGNGFAGGGFEARLAAIGTTGFHAEINAAVASYVATNWPRVDTEWLVEALQARILAAPPGDRSDAQIAAYAAPDALQRRVEWVMTCEAEKHEAQAAKQAQPIKPTYPDRGVTLPEAQAMAKAAVARFGYLMRAGEAPEHMLRVTVGAGKTHEAIAALPELLEAGRIGQGIREWRARLEAATKKARQRDMDERADRMVAHMLGRDWTSPERKPEEYGPAAPPEPGKGAVYFLTSRHDLADEIEGRILAETGMQAARWRGAEQPDPEQPGQKMCQDLPLLAEARRADVEVSAVCKACELRDQCGYQRQRGQQAEVWIGPREMPFQDKPTGLPDAAVVLVDEGFIDIGIEGEDGKKRLAVSALDEDRTPELSGEERRELLHYRGRMKALLEKHEDGQLLRLALEAEGFGAESAEQWAKLEWRTKRDANFQTGMSRADLLQALEDYRDTGFNRRRATTATMLREFLAGDDARSVKLTLATADLGNGQGPGRVVQLAWRKDIAEWAADAPKLLLDATTAPDLVKVWCPKLTVTDIEVNSPNQHVTQVYDKEFGRTWFKTESNVRAIADLVTSELARTAGDVLVITQKEPRDLVEAMLLARFNGALPDRLHLAHHGNLTGIDRWRDVATILVIGRPAVDRLTGERLAEVIRGGAVARVANADSGWWPQAEAGLRMADGTGQRVETSRHPDPLVEAARWTIAEGSVSQAIGRARGVRRTDADPVRVLLLGNMPLPLTVTEATTWESIKPNPVQVAMDQAAVAGQALPLGADDLVAAQPNTFRNAAQVWNALRGVNCNSLIRPSYKRFTVYSAHYWKPGTFRPSLALVPAVGGQAALEAVLGLKLMRFEWLEQPPAAEQAPQAEPQPKPRARPAAKPEAMPEPIATVTVLGEAPPFDPIPVAPPPPRQRDILLLRVLSRDTAPEADTLQDVTPVTPNARERLACLSRRLFQVRPPRPSNDGMNAVRMAHWLERCAQARQEHWRDDRRAAPMADSA